MSTSQGKRIYETFLLVLVASIEGAFTGVLGPTLPALQCMFNTDLSTISSIFFTFGMMNILGSFIAIIILHKVHISPVLIVVITLASVSELVFSFVERVDVAIIVSAVTATFIGMMFNCRIGRCAQLWISQPAPIHIVITGYALGSVFSSLLATPFLPLDNRMASLNNTTTVNKTECSNSTHKVRYVYIILSCLGLALAVTFLISYFLKRCFEDNTNSSLSQSPSRFIYVRGYTLFLFGFFLLCLPAGSLFVTYGSLFSTYGLGAYAVSEQGMSLLTAVYWVTFVVGRLSMSILSVYVKQMWIIVFGYSGLFISMILLLYVNKDLTTLIISTSFVGFFSGPFSALTFSWSGQYVKLTEFVVGIGSIGEYTGAMLFPYIGGLLIAKYGHNAFLYVILGIVVLQFVCFCCLYLIGNYLLERRADDEDSILRDKHKTKYLYREYKSLGND